MALIKVLYSCDICGVDKEAVEVAERAPDQDVVAWMNSGVSVVIYLDHATRSPGCNAEKISRILIPLPKGDGRIGEVTRS